MARNEHKKVLQQLSEAYQTVQERYKMRDPDGDGSWPDDEREEERQKDPNYGEPEEDAENTEATSASFGDNTGYDGPWKTSNSGSPRVRLTRDSPGTSSVYLPEGDPRIQKYLDKGYKIVKDYKKAEQSEDAEDDPLWKKQWDNSPPVSDERWEELQNKKPPIWGVDNAPRKEDEEDDEWNRAENERESARDRAGELSDDWMKQDYESREEDLHPATRAGEEIVGSDVIWDNHQMKGIVKKVDVELGMAIAIDDKGEPHIIELGAVDAILDPNTETPEEFKHLY